MPRCRSPTVVGMSRRSAGAAASTPPRAVAARRSAERRVAGGRAADGRAARRLAATLGPLPDAEGGHASGTPLPDCWTRGTSVASATAAGRDPCPDQEHADGAAEARLRWRLGIRAAVLLGGCVVARWRLVLVAGCDHRAGSHAAERRHQRCSRNGSLGCPGNGRLGPAGDGQGGDSAGTVVVHVAGAVKKAGIVELPRNSRVHQAIAAAGGAAPAADLNRLNLASVLEDGQKIYVPSRGEASLTRSGGRRGSASAGGAGGPGSSGADRWWRRLGSGRQGEPEQRRRRGTRGAAQGRPGAGPAHRRLAQGARPVQDRRGSRCRGRRGTQNARSAASAG